MMVVVVEVDALLLQPAGILVRLLGKVQRRLIAEPGIHRHGADPQHIAVQGLAVVHDLLEVVR